MKVFKSFKDRVNEILGSQPERSQQEGAEEVVGLFAVCALRVYTGVFAAWWCADWMSCRMRSRGNVRGILIPRTLGLRVCLYTHPAQDHNYSEKGIRGGNALRLGPRRRGGSLETQGEACLAVYNSGVHAECC
jgi:hypothetical protein